MAAYIEIVGIEKKNIVNRDYNVMNRIDVYSERLDKQKYSELKNPPLFKTMSGAVNYFAEQGWVVLKRDLEDVYEGCLDRCVMQKGGDTPAPGGETAVGFCYGDVEGDLHFDAGERGVKNAHYLDLSPLLCSENLEWDSVNKGVRNTTSKTLKLSIDIDCVLDSIFDYSKDGTFDLSVVLIDENGEQIGNMIMEGIDLDRRTGYIFDMKGYGELRPGQCICPVVYDKLKIGDGYQGFDVSRFRLRMVGV